MPRRIDPHDVAVALGIPEGVASGPTHDIGWGRLLDFARRQHQDFAQIAHGEDPGWVCGGKLSISRSEVGLWVLRCSCGRPIATALRFPTICGLCSSALVRRARRWREENRCGRCGGSTSGPSRCEHSWAALSELLERQERERTGTT